MSSSDEEVVRRPGRSGRVQSPAESEHHDGPTADDMDVDKPKGDDDDADLFGSDGSEGGFGDEEYIYDVALFAANSTLADCFFLANPIGPWTTSS